MRGKAVWSFFSPEIVILFQSLRFSQSLLAATMSEKLCLQWNDFQENIKSVFGNLREDNDFADVTLACEDGQQVEAHKVILAASSPFFEKILQRHKHPHPLIYLRGFQSQDLLAILDFLYFGEANVFQENLDSFLETTEELKLKGLTGQNTSDVVEKETKPRNLDPAKKTKESFTRSPSFKDGVCNDPVENINAVENVSRTLAIPNELSGDLQALDKKVKSMTGKSQNMIQNGKKSKWDAQAGNSLNVQSVWKRGSCH